MNIGLTFLGILLFGTSLFMMMLILVQRGKGGGLTGALGGRGGQSAFGAKAGDVFTRITVITAIIWITLCMFTIAMFNPPPRDAETRKESGPSSSISGVDDEDAEATENGTATDTGKSDESNADDPANELFSDDSSDSGKQTPADELGDDGDTEPGTDDAEGTDDESDEDSEGPALIDQSEASKSNDDGKSDEDQ